MLRREIFHWRLCISYMLYVKEYLSLIARFLLLVKPVFYEEPHFW